MKECFKGEKVLFNLFEYGMGEHIFPISMNEDFMGRVKYKSKGVKKVFRS